MSSSESDGCPRSAAHRLHGLDWLRAVAALLVVALHAGIAYMLIPMPGLAWATQDPVGSPLVDAAVWWIDSFIMPLFVLMGGFLAAGLFAARGPDAFLRHRTERLLGPFLFACVVILPLDLYAWLLSWAAQDMIPLKKLRSLKVDPPLGEHLWGVSHLWFLEYLWLFCVAAWGAGRVAQWHSGRVAKGDSGRVAKWQSGEVGQWQSGTVAKWDSDTVGKWQSGRVARWVSGLAAKISVVLCHPATLLVISALALWCRPEILLGFRHSWWPLPANLLFYGPWFALGWLTRSRESGVGRARRPGGDPDSRHATLDSALPASRGRLFGCELRVAAALALFSVLLPLIRGHLRSELTEWQFASLIGLFVAHAWLAVTGWFALFRKWLDREPPPAVKYLAEASFWIYLFHHPVVGLTQGTLAPLTLPVAAKFALSLTVATALCLLTYHAFVRHTWVGGLLNGRRVPRSSDVQSFPTPHREEGDGLRIRPAGDDGGSEIRPADAPAEPLRKTA